MHLEVLKDGFPGLELNFTISNVKGENILDFCMEGKDQVSSKMNQGLLHCTDYISRYTLRVFGNIVLKIPDYFLFLGYLANRT